MRIVVIGAGHLGYIVSDFLVNEGYDVVVVDSDGESWRPSGMTWTCSPSRPTAPVLPLCGAGMWREATCWWR